MKLHDLTSSDDLREVSALLAEIWGTSLDASPAPTDLLRAFVHAGGHVCGGRDASGTLLGAAVLVPTADATQGYSLLSGIRPGFASRGLGTRLKTHQRAWMLAHGMRSCRWTFDPLVRRNAWFNLGKLGAEVVGFTADFFGPMHDAVNTGDLSDRLRVVWDLVADLPPTSRPTTSHVGGVEAREADCVDGPDGRPALVLHSDGARTLRLPPDIAAVRAADADGAREWRMLCRRAMLGEQRWADDDVPAGVELPRSAAGIDRDGWLHLRPVQSPEPTVSLGCRSADPAVSAVSSVRP